MTRTQSERPYRDQRGTDDLATLLHKSGLPFIDAFSGPCDPATPIVAGITRLAASGLKIAPPERLRFEGGHPVQCDFSTTKGAALAKMLHAATQERRIVMGRYQGSRGTVYFAKDVDFRTTRGQSHALLRVTGIHHAPSETAPWRAIDGGPWGLDDRQARMECPGGNAAWARAEALFADLLTIGEGAEGHLAELVVECGTTTELCRIGRTCMGPGLMRSAAEHVLAVAPLRVVRNKGAAPFTSNIACRSYHVPDSAILRAAAARTERKAAMERVTSFLAQTGAGRIRDGIAHLDR